MEAATIATILKLAGGGKNAWYHVLHVSVDATLTEIKKQYRKLALKVVYAPARHTALR